jgi:mono/diheme cytochrome c family protein
MNRLIIERIEGRILLGITMFASIMILIGWVAINEPARMASFELQHIGRATERGAELYAANCSTCHGTDGRGIAGRAPAINNPQLFGFDYLGDINSQIGRLQREQQDLSDGITTSISDREALFDQIAGLSEEQRTSAEGTALVEQLTALDNQINTSTERIAAIETELEPLLTERENRIAQLQNAIGLGYLPRLEQFRQQAEAESNPLILTNYIAQDASRLNQVGWGGDLRGYLTTTLIHGRPGSNNVWPAPMVAWSQRAGGPLRDDQISDIVTYMLNWDKGDNWSIGDFNGVNQYALLHADARLVSAGDGPAPVGTDVNAILEAVASLTGDAARGETIYAGTASTEIGLRVGCAACHAGGAVGPATEGTWSRTQNERLTLEQFAGYTVEQYIIESIVRPDAYAVAPYATGLMPNVFGQQLSAQDIADILAYLQGQG